MGIIGSAGKTNGPLRGSVNTALPVRADVTVSLLRRSYDADGRRLIWADVIWSTDVTVVSEAASAAALARQSRLWPPVNRFLDDARPQPGLTPVLFYLAMRSSITRGSCVNRVRSLTSIHVSYSWNANTITCVHRRQETRRVILLSSFLVDELFS